MGIKTGDDPNHPKLLAIREVLTRRPELSKRHLSISHEVGTGTLIAWEKHGWLVFQKAKKASRREIEL